MKRGNFHDGSRKIVFHRLRGLFWQIKGGPVILKPVILKSAECDFVDKILAQTEGRHDNDFAICCGKECFGGGDCRTCFT